MLHCLAGGGFPSSSGCCISSFTEILFYIQPWRCAGAKRSSKRAKSSCCMHTWVWHIESTNWYHSLWPVASVKLPPTPCGCRQCHRSDCEQMRSFGGAGCVFAQPCVSASLPSAPSMSSSTATRCALILNLAVLQDKTQIKIARSSAVPPLSHACLKICTYMFSNPAADTHVHKPKPHGNFTLRRQLLFRPQFFSDRLSPIFTSDIVICPRRPENCL